MIRVGVRELKNRLGRYLQLVRQGQTVEITDRGRPVARLVPEAENSTEALLALSALGFLDPPETPLKDRTPVARSRASVADLLLEDR